MGHWFAAPDSAPSAEAPSGPRTSEPTLQTPAAARTTAAGVGLSAAAVLIAGLAVGTAAALRLLFSGDDRMTFPPAAAGLLLAAFAAGVVALLAVPNRWFTVRPATLALAAVVTLAWPLSGYPVPAGLAAVFAVGLALARDLHRPGGRRVGGGLAFGLLGGLATALVIGGLAVTETHRGDREPVEPAAQSSEPAASVSPGTSEPSARSPEPATSPSPQTAATPEPQTGAASPTPSEPGPETAPTSPTEAAPEASPPPVEPGTETAPTSPTEATPEASPPPADVPAPPSPESFVRAYYAHLNAKRFEEAWDTLSPAVQRSFGDLERWRDGYGRTISSSPREFEVDGARVTHVLVARDRGCPERRFRVRWRLEPADGAYRVVALSASALDAIACR